MKNAPDLAGAPAIPNLHRSVRSSKVWDITKEIPKKTKDLFELFCVPFPKKQIKN